MPMSSIETLRREYPGDSAWSCFAAVFSADAVNGLQDAARSLLPNDLGLAETLIGMFGRAGAADWLNRPIDVLDGQSPAHILSTHPAGCRIVPHALMRMPV